MERNFSNWLKMIEVSMEELAISYVFMIVFFHELWTLTILRWFDERFTLILAKHMIKYRQNGSIRMYWA